MSAVSRHFVFTWNNPPPDAFDQLTAFRPLTNQIAVGSEVGASGTPHLQGFVTLKKPQRLSGCIRLFNIPAIHFETLISTPELAIAYTHKDDALGGPRLDWDDRHAGSRSDLKALSSLVTSDPRNAEYLVATQMPTMMIKYPAGIKALARAVIPLPPLIQPKIVSWFFGISGTGKSHNAIAEARALGASEDDIYPWSNGDFQFADGYTGQRFVIFEELRATWKNFTYSRLLVLLDKYRTSVGVKFGSYPWCATHIWITCPFHPDQMCPIEELRINHQAQAQLTRRLSTLREYTVVHSDAYAALPLPPSPPSSRHPSRTVSIASRGQTPVRRGALALSVAARFPSVSIARTESLHDSQESS